jgi:hypothetical protein
MRRMLGVVLTGFGGFLIVLAGFMWRYAPGQVIKFPLDEYQVTTLHADNVSYFSPAKLQELSGVSITATDTVRGDVAAGTGSVAVWDEFTYVHDDTNGQEVSYDQRRAPFDRRTGRLVNCCGAFVDSNHSVQLSGQGFVWPFNAQKKTYMVFDTTLLRPVPATFAGTGTVDGVPVYRYVEHVAPQQSGTQTLPGSLVGMPDQPSVTLPEYYAATNTYWVDPVTGATDKTDQDQTLTLRDAAGATRLVLFQGDLSTDAAAIRGLIGQDRTGRNEIGMFTVIGPLAGVLVGVVALVVGITLGLSGGPAPETARRWDEAWAR